MMSTVKNRIAILASGSGTNAEEIMEYFQSDHITQVACLWSNNPEAYALERAKKFGISTHVFTRTEFKEASQILPLLQEKQITHIVLAGFLWLIPPYLIQNYPHKIINIHPALLPKYGGKGMYGMRVHQSVKESGDTETGITIHEVDEVYDHGKVLFQIKCDVVNEDSAEDIANRVHQLEYAHYPKVIEEWILDSN